MLASGGDDGQVLLWELETIHQRPLRKPLAHKDWVRAVAFDMVGRTVVSGGWDGRVCSCPVQERGGRELIPSPHPAICCLATSSDDLELAVGDMDGRITRVWIKNSRTVYPCWAAHRGAVRSLVYAHAARLLVSAGHDRAIRLWDSDWGKDRGTLGSHPDWIYCLALTPDGKTLASAGEDGAIRLWDLPERKAIAILEGHDKSVRHLAFSRDGRTLFSGGWDGILRRWDVEARRLRSTLDFQIGRVHCVALAPDEMTAAAGFGRGADGGIVVWDLD
jgi:WD40 repeat protein